MSEGGGNLESMKSRKRRPSFTQKIGGSLEPYKPRTDIVKQKLSLGESLIISNCFNK
jgi:hypothetical protein